MNKFTLKLVMIAVLCVAACTAKAQAYLEDPKYGNSPEERKQNVMLLNYFNDAYSMKDYDLAVKHLHTLLKGAPKASQNLYINGANIYKNKIARATSSAEKSAYVDTLMMIYDFRIANFGDHPTRGKAYLLGLKAQEYLQFKPTDREGVRKTFKEAITAAGNEADLEIVTHYFNALVEDYKADLIETEFLLGEYDNLVKLFDVNPTDETKAAKKTFEALFISSGAANCENLEKLFAPRLAAAPNDPELIEKAMGLLMRNNCVSDFQLELAQKYYKIKPSSATALSIAAAFEAKKDFTKAREYLNEAISAEKDPVMKANLAVRIGGGELSQGNARAAADFARQAIEINPENGYAYVILAQAYATGSNQCGDFARQSVFWLVVDTLSKARELLADDAQQVGNIDAQIASYRNHFPTNEECFFRGLDKGAGYSVSCGWISGRTTVRTVR